MAYHRRRLLEKIEQSLLTRPQISLSGLSNEMGIERHTIEKAIKEVTGSTFRQYRREKMLARHCDQPPRLATGTEYQRNSSDSRI